MSVGGVIIDIVPVRDDKWWISTISNYEWTLTISPEKLAKRAVAVYCDPRPERPEVGDAFWWQGDTCYWTPRMRPDGRHDVPLKKISGSGVPHPHAAGEIEEEK